MNNTFSLFNSRLVAGLLFIAISLPSTVFAETNTDTNEAMDLLNRMHQSLHQLNYKGTLVYRRGESMSTLQIDHSVVNGVRRERVVRLNEQGGEVSRELKGFSLASIPVIRPHMEKVYSFDLGRENRVANIPCRIITARPKDRVRYLQKYCIDPDSGLLLDYMLVGKTHKPVEQFMFTSIEFSTPEGGDKNTEAVLNKEIIESLPLDIELQMNGAETVLLNKSITPVVNSAKPIAIATKTNAVRQISTNQLDDGWIMEALPIGFKVRPAPMKKGSSKTGDNSLNKTKHYIVSDGLSSLSVFISPLTDDTNFGAVKINSGALNVVSQQNGDAIITIVGEVPEETLRNIIDKLKKKQP